MTSLGAMRASIRGLSSEIGWKEKDFRKAFQKPLSLGMIRCNEKLSYIDIPNFIKYNQPESPNVVKSWDGILDMIPECSLKYDLMHKIRQFVVSSMGEAFHKALPEAFDKAMPNPEPEPKPFPEPFPPIAPPMELCDVGRKMNGNCKGCLEAFSKFWESYPRHEPPKSVTLKSWCKVWKAQMEIGPMMSWIEKAKASEQWQDKKFIPHATVFLNQRRWEGDPPPAEKKGFTDVRSEDQSKGTDQLKKDRELETERLFMENE
jgi:hypothetical protein